jgi:hypothetical protein
MVRIEEFNTFPAGSVLTFAFDDWLLLPLVTDKYKALDIKFNYFVGTSSALTSDYYRYYILLKEMILLNGRKDPSWASINKGITPISPPNSYA